MIIRTEGLGPMVSRLERFHCMQDTITLYIHRTQVGSGVQDLEVCLHIQACSSHTDQIQTIYPGFLVLCKHSQHVLAANPSPQ